MAEEKKIKGTTVIGEGNSMTIIPKKSSTSSSSSSSGTGSSTKVVNDTGRTIVSGEGNNMTIIPKSSNGNRMSSSGGSGGTSTNYGSYQSDLNRLTEAQRQAQVEQLKAARKQALANLDAQEREIKPYYQTARNQTAASSQQGARNFAEYLANRGLTNSGAAAQGEINRLSGLNNNLGNINTAEANALRNIANQRTAVENDYVAGLANANNAITSDYYKNLLNYNEQQRQYVQNLRNQALGQYANNYQAYIDTLPVGSLERLEAEAARGNKVNTLYNNGLNNALTNVQNGYINYNNAAALGLTTPQAYNYSNNYQAQVAAANQAQQEALARDIAQANLTNEINLQKLAIEQQKADDNSRKIAWQTSVPKSSGRSSTKSTSNDNNEFKLTDKEISNALSNLSSSDRLAKINELAPNMTEDQYLKARLGAI